MVEGINDLATLKPQLAQEWSKKNELKPTEVSVASHKKIIWKCKHGHEWTASIKSRTLLIITLCMAQGQRSRMNFLKKR